jgi:hypothetical protein
VKLKKAGVGANFCIHKYFFERSDTWKTVKAEEKSVTQENEQDEEPGDDGTEPSVRFNPIDARHLSSLPLLRSRLAKLLKNCPSNMHKYGNLVVAIVRARMLGSVHQSLTSFRAFVIPPKQSVGSFILAFGSLKRKASSRSFRFAGPKVLLNASDCWIRRQPRKRSIMKPLGIKRSPQTLKRLVGLSLIPQTIANPRM